MAEDTHSDDLRNVNEGDTVEITTTEGEIFEAKCTNVNVDQSDEAKTGLVRTTTTWLLDAVEHQPLVQVVDGLRATDGDPDFPVHKEMYDRQQEGSMGFIESISIGGT